MSSILSRASWASLLGKSYQGNRDLYKTLGYSRTLQFSDHWGLYERQDIAERIINAPVDACWRITPQITDLIEDRGEDDETDFEAAWRELVRDHRITHYLARLDRLSRVGRYGVLLLGVNDGRELSEPLDTLPEGRQQLIYLSPFSEGHATIKDYVIDTRDPRYGLPESYWLKYTDQDITLRNPGTVHHSRVLHVAEGLLEDDVFGRPALQSVFNRLQDLEKVTGGSAEMFWRGARKEYSFTEKDGADWDTSIQSDDDLKDEIDNFVHGMQNYMRLSDLDVKSLAPQVVSPGGHVEVLVDLIAGATGIPKRILLGSERGELASSQDETNWGQRIAERREQHVAPNVIRPFINRMIEVGVLPEPEGEGYSVEFPVGSGLSERDRAEISRTRTEALARYSDSLGAPSIVPPEQFLTQFLGMTDEQVDQILGQQIEDADGEDDE